MEEGLLTSDVEPVLEVHMSEGQRMDICHRCPLFIREDGVCNPSLWLNVETGETARRSLPGYKRGCGCLVTRKAKQPNSHCHLGKW